MDNVKCFGSTEWYFVRCSRTGAEEFSLYRSQARRTIMRSNRSRHNYKIRRPFRGAAAKTRNWTGTWNKVSEIKNNISCVWYVLVRLDRFRNRVKKETGTRTTETGGDIAANLCTIKHQPTASTTNPEKSERSIRNFDPRLFPRINRTLTYDRIYKIAHHRLSAITRTRTSECCLHCFFLLFYSTKTGLQTEALHQMTLLSTKSKSILTIWSVFGR